MNPRWSSRIIATVFFLVDLVMLFIKICAEVDGDKIVQQNMVQSLALSKTSQKTIT